MQKLIWELNVTTIPTEKNNYDEWRFIGGCETIVDKLHSKFNKDIIELNQLVIEIT